MQYIHKIKCVNFPQTIRMFPRNETTTSPVCQTCRHCRLFPYHSVDIFPHHTLIIVWFNFACSDLGRICAISTHKLVQPSTKSFLQQSVAHELAKQPIESSINEELDTIADSRKLFLQGHFADHVVTKGN